MGGSSIQNATTIKSDSFEGELLYNYQSMVYYGETGVKNITIEGTDINLKDINYIEYLINNDKVRMIFEPEKIGLKFILKEDTPNKKVITLVNGGVYFFEKKFQPSGVSDIVTGKQIGRAHV